MSRYSLCSLLAAVVVAVVALSPSAYADDDDLFTPTGPSIVVGGTVHPPGTIVVDPETPAATTGPIDPSKPIDVDPSARVNLASPTCCEWVKMAGFTQLVGVPYWPSYAKPPVKTVEVRPENGRTAYLDNHGRYWVLYKGAATFEQVGGWPAPLPTASSPQLDPYKPIFGDGLPVQIPK
ncbi:MULTISPECIES: hypothetical protein [unclassified Mycobacterium]|uniref:hypothetical protein n=1 Tax=unclassified Mycobacterium TaxID=2642494 RepID=UPI0029C75E5F|nr:MULTISPECIES: hypothetical protein [unclassified Mycobacterium]